MATTKSLTTHSQHVSGQFTEKWNKVFMEKQKQPSTSLSSEEKRLIRNVYLQVGIVLQVFQNVKIFIPIIQNERKRLIPANNFSNYNVKSFVFLPLSFKKLLSGKGFNI